MSNSQTDRGRSARNCHRPLVALSDVVCPAPLRTSHVCPTPILTVVDQRGIVTGSQKPWFHVITAALCKLGEEQSERIFPLCLPKAGNKLSRRLLWLCMACSMHDARCLVLGRLVGGGLSAAACRRRLVVGRLFVGGLVLGILVSGGLVLGRLVFGDLSSAGLHQLACRQQP